MCYVSVREQIDVEGGVESPHPTTLAVSLLTYFSILVRAYTAIPTHNFVNDI